MVRRIVPVLLLCLVIPTLSFAADMWAVYCSLSGCAPCAAETMREITDGDARAIKATASAPTALFARPDAPAPGESGALGQDGAKRTCEETVDD